MKLLVFGINYSPELTGIGKYTSEMCAWLSEQGHNIDVITAMPYYPEWKIHSKYQNKYWHTEMIEGAKVHRCPLYVPQNITGSKRIIHEFSFLVSSSIFWIKTLFKKHDVIICICPPFHIGFIAWFFKSIKRTPIIYHIQDLQVDAARNLKILKSDFLLTVLENAEKFILKRMNKVSSISEGMKKNILKKGVKESNYISLPNWVDTDFIKPINNVAILKTQLGYKEEDKIILYSGNLGEKQGLDIILEAAEALKSETNIHFLLVGEGANKKQMQDIALSKKLNNLKFNQLFPYEQLPVLLSLADIHLVIQKSLASDLMLPSKLLSILSSGGLAIVTAEPNTSLYEIIQNNQAGIIIPPESSSELLIAIKNNIFKDNQHIKNNARKFAIEELNKDNVLRKFENQLLILTQ
ncbi:MAG: colanic acid biosynthesis glycosyltransferase WcaI [Cytophagales bacterium]|nr:MAG: colanic acid biosynthesis glycosyltransferase WcaI [Cytophagales bacterium]